jgi:hypothetical protein
MNLKQKQHLKLDVFGHTLEYFGLSLEYLWSAFGCLWVTLDDLGVQPANVRESLFDKGMLSGYTAWQDVQD